MHEQGELLPDGDADVIVKRAREDARRIVEARRRPLPPRPQRVSPKQVRTYLEALSRILGEPKGK